MLEKANVKATQAQTLVIRCSRLRHRLGKFGGTVGKGGDPMAELRDNQVRLCHRVKMRGHQRSICWYVRLHRVMVCC